MTVSEMTALLQRTLSKLPASDIARIVDAMDRFQQVPLRANVPVRREVFYQRLHQAMQVLLKIKTTTTGD